MDIVKGQIKKERFRFVAFPDQPDGLMGNAIAKVFPFLAALGQSRNSSAMVGFPAPCIVIAIRPEKARRRSALVACDVDVEALLLRQKLFAMPEMPLAYMPRGVTGIAQDFSERHLGQRQFLVDLRRQVFAGLVVAGDVVSDLQPSWIAPGQQRRTGRRAIGMCGIPLSKPHAFPGQLIEVWRFVKRAAIAGQVSPAQIVGEDHDNIQFLF